MICCWRVLRELFLRADTFDTRRKKYSQFCEGMNKSCIFAYLQELYVNGRSTNKKHRFQPDVVARYVKVVNTMKNANNVFELTRFKGLHYEHLIGDKEGISSVRVNDKYRIEFTESAVDNQQIATICNIIELSNHYK